MNDFNDPADTPANPSPDAISAPSAADREREVNMWASFTHFSALAGLLGIPAGNVIGPLTIWMIKRDSLPEIDEHGKEALNFQITMLIAMVLSIPLFLVFIGIFTLIATMVVQLVFTIIAGVKASEGTAYRYPISIQFLT